jgi:hypothetical protein
MTGRADGVVGPHCLRCGAPVAPGTSVCHDCNPAGLPAPSSSQYHATVFVAVLLSIVLLAALALYRG